MRRKAISLFRKYAALENEAYDLMVESGFEPAHVALWERRAKHCERYAYLRGLLNDEGRHEFESRTSKSS